MAVLLGQSTTGVNSANSNGAGVAFAQRYQCLATGTIDTLWLNVGTSGGAVTLHAAVYADSAGPLPGARLTADLTQAAAFSQWNSITGFSLAVTAGTKYWIAWLPVGNAVNYTNFADTGGTEEDHTGLASLPNPYAGTSGNANVANVYASGSLPSVVTPRPVRVINQAVGRAANW